MNLRSIRAAHYGAEEVDLRNVSFPVELLNAIPAELARRCRVLPVSISPQKLKLALADPSDIEVMETIQRFVQRDLEISVAEASQLDEFIKRLYGSEGTS
jgi:hypothetical protein